ncbi:PROM2 protein, partial [Leiothrix lutea]|nr:PROM2 protein [Leiothrix lutea]
AMRAAGLLLAWALLHPAASQQCHPSGPGGVLRFTDRHAEIQVPALHRVPSSLDPLYGLVRRCLDLIQQNPLPTELLRTALNDPGSVRTSQVVQYELGYVICAAVALLFTVAVPVAGMCFCYCRSRRRCGGRLRAHRRSLGCRRRCLLACLSFTSLIILISVTCAFVTSQRVKGQMEPGLGAVPSTLRTLRQHLANVPQAPFSWQGVQMVVDKFEVPRKQIISDLGGLSRSVGLSIHAQLKAMTYAALADLQDRAGDLQTSLHHLQILHRTARALAAARAELEPALQERRRRVVALLDDPRCTSCASVLGRAQGLELGADYSKVPSVEKVLKALAGLPRSDFAEMIRQVGGSGWIAGTVLCSIILLILLCNVTGMALGAYGLSKREDPSDYECRGEAGAKFLLVGVGLAFLFSWLLTLLVFATFLVGGNIQTLVCRNWVNQEIYKFIDTPGNLPPSMNLTRQLNLRRDSNLSSTYRWTLLQDVPHTRAGFWAALNSISLQMKNPVVQTSLPGLARNLEGLQKMQRNSTVAGRLAAEAQALWHMQNSTVQSQEALVAKLRESVQFLSHLAPHLKEQVKRTLATTASVEARLPVQAQQILRARCGLMPCLCSLFQLREDVASCQPLATALDNGQVILCDRIADPWNAFWFSLGCCTFFLIPNIIFAVRLTKHFRPIRNRLISTGSEETCPFHIPRVTALKL